MKAAYNTSDVSIGIVHIGVGNFHRAHQAYYNDLAMEKTGDLSWGIAGVSLKSRKILDALKNQQGLYTVKMFDADSQIERTVGCLREFFFLGDGIEPINQLIARPTVHILSLTITEKGYHDNSVGSAVGVLASGLMTRFNSSKSPLTILSCDNIQGNGDFLAGLIKKYCAEIFYNEDFDNWLVEFVSFPNTMVDRIVPSITNDNCSLETEKFGQWVIEDKFVSKRPAWDQVGVQFVKDVHVYEQLKLSMLNATHSYLAYFGTLKSYDFVSEAIHDNEIIQDLKYLMYEELPLYIQQPKNFLLKEYGESLIHRFQNKQLQHKLLQISMDGSIKIPQRWIPSLDYNLKNKKSIKGLCKCLASWILFCVKAKSGAWELLDPDKEHIFNHLSSDPIEFLKTLPELVPEHILNQQPLQQGLIEEYKILEKRFL